MRHALIIFLLITLRTVAADDIPRRPTDVAAAIDQGLAFLAKDALAWKAKHNCVSCHHAGLTVWSMNEAKQRGHKIDETVLADLTKWIAESGDGKTSVPRPPGRPKALNTKAVVLALALESNPKPDAASRQSLNRLLETVRADQTDNGSWSAWPDTRPPLFGPSDDTATSLATLAVLPAASESDSAKTARDKGAGWLADTKTDDDPQSIAMRLVLWQRLGRSAKEFEPWVNRISERQNADGGWSQSTEMASDAWATGQALYALAHAGIKEDDPSIKRAHAFLIKTQRPDGSWPMTSRPNKPGGSGAKYLVPITGAGSAWAVLGLVRTRGEK